MSLAKLTSKAQITIPSDVRKDLRVGPGDHLEFVKDSQGRFIVSAAKTGVRKLKGIVKSDRVVSIEEMDQAIKMRASGNSQ